MSQWSLFFAEKASACLVSVKGILAVVHRQTISEGENCFLTNIHMLEGKRELLNSGNDV